VATDGGPSADEVVKQAKAQLRQRILARRDAVESADRKRNSAIITQKLLALPAYQKANVLAAYASFGSELDTSEFLVNVLADGKQLLLPRINRPQHALELRQVTDLRGDLVAGVWGIQEPAERCPIVAPALVNFMLVPGVAFTEQGARLGYGGGYYDRLLARLNASAARIAGAFELQMVNELPETQHDQRINYVVTER
jgi:5-formyltetrahydrofolate cyclo-ligase